MDWLSTNGGDVILAVRVVPRATRNELAGVLDGALKIRLQSPPVDGKANKALVRFLAKVLGVPASRVELVSGAAARHKRICIRDTAPAAVLAALRRVPGCAV